MIMFNFAESSSKKLLTAFSLIFILVSPFSFANKKIDKIQNLIVNGSVDELTLAFVKNNFMNRTRFDKNGDTLVLEAIEKNREPAIIKLLLKGDVKLKAKNKNGQSALHYLALYAGDNPDLIKFVLNEWGDKEDVSKGLLVKDKFGKNPYEYALDKEDKNMLSIFAGYLGEEVASSIYRKWMTAKQNAYVTENEIESFSDTEPQTEPESTEAVTENAASENDNEIDSEPFSLPAEENYIKSDVSSEIKLDETEKKSEAVKDDVFPAAEVKENTEIEKEPDAEVKPVYEPKKEVLKTSVDIEKKQKELLNAKGGVKTSGNDKTYLFDYEPRAENLEPKEFSSKEIQLAQIKNPNTRDFNGRTLLMKAVKDGNDWEIRSLINSGADLNLRDNEGWSALMFAIRYQNNLEIVKLLLDNGADIYTVNKYGSSPLQIAACYSGNPEILRLIIQKFKGNQNDIFKAFIFSITSNVSNISSQLAKLQVFIDRGISINRFYEGKTPLMYACEYTASTSVIKLLLDNGANPSIRDANGKKAFDYAKLNGKLERDETYWKLNSN